MVREQIFQSQGPDSLSAGTPSDKWYLNGRNMPTLCMLSGHNWGVVMTSICPLAWRKKSPKSPKSPVWASRLALPAGDFS